MMRDTPWLFSVGVLVASLVGAAGGLYLYSKSIFNAVITGQGYFVKNLIYSTVAEAQAPSFDSLIVSYGAVTFFLAFIGLGVFGYYLYRHKVRREHLFMVVLGVIGMYLPVTAAKFFLIGSPLFAILPAEVLLFALDKMGYTEMRRTASTLSETGGYWFAFRRSFKARHVLIIIIALGVLLPNVWYAVDAGIPYNTKSQYNEQVFHTLPPALQTTSSQASQFYFGAAGIQIDTPTQYDENGYDWLATQDTNTIPSERAAFISWWDYGFQAVEEGKHPSVADNFQDGIDPSGHFLLAQNESTAISVLTVDLLFAERAKSGQTYLPGPLNAELRADGLNLTLLHTYLVNTSADIPMVLQNPTLYGPVNAANLDGENAMYYVLPAYIAGALSENGVVRVYQTVQAYTGWSIGYAMADTRLFPTSGSNTGIFYAPVDLTDGVVAGGGVPTYYFTVTATGSDGNTYPLGSVPPGVQVVSTNINYLPAFYNSMIYHTFVGYNGSEVGAGSGIPGLSNGLTSYQVEPAWMMQHFVMGYRTAYYCPYKNYTQHPGCFGAVSLATAQAYQTAGTGTADTSSSSYFSGGETILEY
jgi:dolichyl-diphosphooligosaccharide--protein glycosyltransferase